MELVATEKFYLRPTNLGQADAALTAALARRAVLVYRSVIIIKARDQEFRQARHK